MGQAPAVVVAVVTLLAVAAALPGVVGADRGESSHAAPDTRLSAAAEPIDDCLVIRASGYYRLSGDILDTSADRCIQIFASDVVLDGDGHRIDGVDRYLFTTRAGVQTATKGILVKDGPHRNVTITGVKVTDFGYGIWISDTVDSRIVHSEFTSNGIYGIYVGYDAHNATIADNRVVDINSPNVSDPGLGIALAHHANRNRIVDNYVRDVEAFGIEVSASNRTWIENNTVLDAGRHGITGEGDGSVIIDNVVRRSRDVGIDFRLAAGTRISGNEVVEGRIGIALAKSNDTVISRNVVRRNNGTGIRLHGGTTAHWGDISSENVSILDNQVSDNGGSGIFLPRHNNDSTIRGNVVTGNADRGIHLVRNQGNRLRNNTIHANRIGVHVIAAGGTVIDRNAFRDNVEWAVNSQRHAVAIRVTDAFLNISPSVSFNARNVGVVEEPTAPSPLPSRARPVSGFIRVWPETGGGSWIDLTIEYDPSRVARGGDVALMVYDGAWRTLPESAVTPGPASLSHNATVGSRTRYFVVVAAANYTPTPTASPTTTPSQPGFGFVVGLLGLLLAAMAAWIRLRSRLD